MPSENRLIGFFCVFSVFVLLLAGTQAGFAQAADLSGIVSDPSGAVIPNAFITARDIATNQTRVTNSDSQGRYIFPHLGIGSYEITAKGTGFQAVKTRVELTIGQRAELNLTLNVRVVTEEVTVSSGGAAVVETETSTLGTLVSERQIEQLPLNGRDFSQLILLQPGTAAARSDQGDILSGKGSKISVHGGRTNGNAYMLDGSDILDALGRNSASAQGIVSGIESVQEFTVLSNTYSAEYGRASGGVFNIATRSGSNDFHGSVFEYLRNSALDARNFFDDPNAPQPPFKRNQFGAAAGGAIVKDKLFFFGTYEGFRERLGVTDVESVPSLSARNGIVIAPNGTQSTVTISPAVLPYLALIPLPTQPDPRDPNKGIFLGQFNQSSNLDTFNGRVDYNLSSNDVFFVRYTHNNSDFLFLNPETFPAFPNTGTNHQRFLSASHVHVFSSNIVNNVRYAFNRTTPSESPAPVDGFSNLAFIPGQIVGDIAISGFKRFGTDRNTPRSFFQNLNQLSDDLSIAHGAHSFKVGGNVEHFDIDGISASRNRGEFTINTFTDFLQGKSRNFVGLAPGKDDVARHHHQMLFGFYFQDDWRLLRSLRLNMGLRYEFITVPTEVDGKVTNVRTPLDPAATLGDPLFKNPSLRNFAPRVGFAYSPQADHGFLRMLAGGPGKTAIRGGFGIFYDELLYSTYGNMTFKHLPFFQQIQISNAPFPNVFPLLASGVGQTDTFAMQFKPSPTYVMQYNFNIQREISSKVTITTAYVGARGNHLWRESDFNIAFPLNSPLDTLFPPIAANLVQRRNPNFGSIRFKIADAQSFYNSFQLGAIARPVRGLQSQLSYTYAKSIDDASSSLGRNEFANGQARSVDPFNRKLNRGLSDFDVRHNLSLNFLYDLPFGRGQSFGSGASGFTGALIGGWQLNGILTATSGIPVTPIFTFDQDRDGSTDNEQRPNLAPGARIHQISQTQLFDPTIFLLPPVGSRGTLGRNVIAGPGLVTFDPAVVKSFFYSEDHKRSVQFRSEFFNVFNHPNFAIPDVSNLTVFNSPTQRNTTAGQITRTSTSSRQLQFALRVNF